MGATSGKFVHPCFKPFKAIPETQLQSINSFKHFVYYSCCFPQFETKPYVEVCLLLHDKGKYLMHAAVKDKLNEPGIFFY
jgi:hypothetical protein